MTCDHRRSWAAGPSAARKPADDLIVGGHRHGAVRENAEWNQRLVQSDGRHRDPRRFRTRLGDGAWRSRASFDPDRASQRTWLDCADQLETMAATAAPDPVERIRLVEAISRLSEDHRAIVVDVHIGGRSYAEVAAQNGVPVATLRTRAFHAMRALRSLLDEAGDGG